MSLRKVERPLLHAHRNAILTSHATPDAIGEMVAALGDADERIRWLAGSALASLKDARVVEAVAGFLGREQSLESKLSGVRFLEQVGNGMAQLLLADISNDESQTDSVRNAASRALSTLNAMLQT